MATVNDSRDRAQLIMITGLLVAFVLVALVLLLNSAIYTENLSTRGVDNNADDAAEYQRFVADNAERLIERENERGVDESNVTDGIRNISAGAMENNLQRGTVAVVNVTDVEIGSEIQQSTPGSLASGDGTPETIVENADHVGNFTLIVDTADLNGTDDRFKIRNGSGWNVDLYTDGGDTVVENASGDRVYQDSTGAITIDFRNGTVEGAPAALEWSTSHEQIEFVDNSGNDVQGRFWLTTDGDRGDRGTDTPIVYSAEFRLEYETADLLYETDVRVAPSESP